MDNILRFSALGLSFQGDALSLESTKVLNNVYNRIRKQGGWLESTKDIPFGVDVIVDKGDIIYIGNLEYLNLQNVLRGSYKWKVVDL